MGSVGNVNSIINNTSEARKMSREEAKSLLTTPIVDAELEGGLIPTAYAKELFKHYYYMSRQSAENGDPTGAWNSFYVTENDPLLSKRTARGVQQLINSEVRDIEMDVSFGIFSADEGNRRRKALDMVQRTLNNAVKNHRNLWKRS